MPEPAAPDNNPDTPAFEGLVQDILFHNPFLTDKIARSTAIPRNAVPELLLETVRFLHLVAHHPGPLTPSHLVDMAWHELILCTRYYAEFCAQHFGRFLHHQPGGDQADHQRAFERTFNCYHDTFGAPPLRYWSGVWNAEEASSCGSCSGPSS